MQQRNRGRSDYRINRDRFEGCAGTRFALIWLVGSNGLLGRARGSIPAQALLVHYSVCWLTRYRFVGQTGEAAGRSGGADAPVTPILARSTGFARDGSAGRFLAGREGALAGAARKPRRKPRLRTELSEADERHLQEAMVLFGLPKAEVVRRLIRGSVQAGPALSAENTKAVVCPRQSGPHCRSKPVAAPQGNPSRAGGPDRGHRGRLARLAWRDRRGERRADRDDRGLRL